MAGEKRTNCPCARCRIRGIMGPVMLITVGAIFLLGEHSIDKLWPLFLIVPGVILLVQSLASREGHIVRSTVSNGGQQRSPLFAGLLLILLGVIFFANQFYPEFGLGRLIERYWPVLVILWGVSKLIDHYSAQKSGEPRGPLLSGGEAALLILLALVLATFVFRDWLRHEFPGVEIHMPGFERSLSRARSLPPLEIPAGAHVTVDTAHGDIKVVGVDGNELRVSMHVSAGEGSQGEPGDRLQGANAVIDRTADGYLIHPANQSSWQSPATVDFDIQVPKMTPVTLNTSHGDVDAEGIAGMLDVRTQSGDIRIQHAGTSVSADSQKGDVRIRGVTGNVQLHGGGDDVEISEITGDVAIEGAFVGDIKVQKARGALLIKSPRAEVTVAQMTGDLSLDSGDLAISGATGLVKVNAQDKDVSIQGAIDRLEITDSRGDINVRLNKPPGYDVGITSDTGDVELTLPAQSSFQLAAVSRSGDVKCEFEGPFIPRGNKSDGGRIDGFFKGTALPSGTPAPRISIATNYGDIEVNKS